jgi:tetratricopeptide (TPR) repeat protein
MEVVGMKKLVTGKAVWLAAVLCLSFSIAPAQGVGTIGGGSTTKPKPAPPKPKPSYKPAPKAAPVASRIEAAPVRRPAPKPPRPRPGGGKSNAELAEEALAQAKEARKAGDIEEAIGHLQRAARLDPKDYESRALLGFIYADQNELDDALLWANRAVQADSTAYYSYASLGWTQYKRGSYVEAENAYRASLRIAERYATAAVSGLSFELARTLNELRRYRETLPLLEKSIQNDPNDYSTRFFYGVMLQKVGQLNQAVEQYRQASVINSKDSAPFSNSGLVYYMLSDNAKARQAWETAIQLGSTYLPDSAGLLILRCDLRGAREKLEAYTRESGGDEDGWLLLGDVLRAQNDESGARMADARAAAIAPEYSGLRRPVLRCGGSGVGGGAPPRPNNTSGGNTNSEACQAARQVNENKATTLMAAAAQNRNDLIPAILACGIDPNAGDKDGDTALIYAAAADNAKAIELITQAGGRANGKNKNGITPLMIAAFMGKEAAVKALLARGADVNLKDNSGKTALTYAREKKFDNIVSLLQKAAW